MYKIKVVMFGGAAGSGKSTASEMVERICAAHRDHAATKVYKEALANPLKKMVRLAFPAFTNVDLYGPSHFRETEYPQYPFSGMCLSCGIRCNQFVDTHKDGDGFRGEPGKWVCSRCGKTYPRFVTPRLALQALGTEWGRRLNEDVWAEALKHRIHDIYLAHCDKDPLGHESPIPTTLLFLISDARFENELRAVKEKGFDSNCLTILLTRNFPDTEEPIHESEQIHLIPRKLWDHTIDNSSFTLGELYGALVPIINSFVGGTDDSPPQDAG